MLGHYVARFMELVGVDVYDQAGGFLIPLAFFFVQHQTFQCSGKYVFSV
jgi:hypothetical protein